MLVFHTIFISYCSILSSTALKSQQGRQFTHVDRFDGACGDRKLPLIATIQGMKFIGNKLFMNSTLTARENLTSNMRSEFLLLRCGNKENLDTCENFYEFKTDDYCTFIQASTWSSLTSAFKPPFKCPIMKGYYRAENSVLDISALVLFPIERWYWRAKIMVYSKDNNRLLQSICADAYFGSNL